MPREPHPARPTAFFRRGAAGASRLKTRYMCGRQCSKGCGRRFTIPNRQRNPIVALVEAVHLSS